MEVGPTCHYIMGGVRVDADTAATAVPGLFAAGEVAGGMHGSNRLGGNSLSDLLVFGRRAGMGASDFAEARSGSPRRRRHRGERAVAEAAVVRSNATEGENPYELQHDLQELMQNLVGIIRTGLGARDGARPARRAARSGRTTSGSRAAAPTTPAGTSPPTCRPCSPCRGGAPSARSTARRAAAGTPARTSRRPDPEFGKINLVLSQPAGGGMDGEIKIAPEPIPEMPDELQAAVRGGKQVTDVTMRVWRGDADGGEFRDYVDARARGRGRARRHPPHPGRPAPATSRAAGTARPGSAARARPRSTGGPASCA